MLQSGTAGVRVWSPGAEARVGDEVEAVGFPAVTEFTTDPHDAVVRVVGPGRLPDPVGVGLTDPEARPGDEDLDLRLVRIRGTPRLTEPADGGVRLHVEQGRPYFAGLLPGGGAGGRPAARSN